MMGVREEKQGNHPKSFGNMVEKTEKEETKKKEIPSFFSLSLFPPPI